jgi:hypothetical protein
LAAVANAAKKEVEVRAVSAVDLELEARPVVLSTDDIVDLTDDDDEGQEVVVFTLQSGRSLRARPGSIVVRHHRDAEMNPFERAFARDIGDGETIVVPDRSFVDEVRRVLPVKVLAQSWVLVYHTALEAALTSARGRYHPGQSPHADAADAAAPGRRPGRHLPWSPGGDGAARGATSAGAGGGDV